MNLVVDRKGKFVAFFKHYSDSVIFIEEDHGRHGYERVDEPGLDQQLAELLSRPRVNDAGRD